ncbi:redoxin domain-containing protein [Cytophagaceae bacterium DM2B3-1]|uniref:Redoxin domain-containing protein n=1 Tax=Xanthocytophaga flava TaxID=3048013 RepID=A0ABT7CK54_9BACT|nr:redoxin domain-containing protein [Xanthocytophaga flavus]MDJ1472361.1 redoxin domain-containing protein [Xanthocytophaga flavus]MDJ1493059.1 redoxin domain-containing protein [Xanthocytophaga flavus]
MKLIQSLSEPVFRLKDIYGRMIDLEEYKDKKVFIGFFRHAGCPFCNIRVHKLLKVREELLEKCLEMIFFFESPENILLQSIFHKEISPIPLISDPEKRWYSAYGLEPSTYKATMSHISSFVQTAFKASSLGVPLHAMAEGGAFNTMPAEFLLSEGLIIEQVHYSERLNDRMSVEKIRAFVEKN